MIAEVARPWFTRQAQFGRRLIFGYRGMSTRHLPSGEGLVGLEYPDEATLLRVIAQPPHPDLGLLVGGGRLFPTPEGFFPNWEHAEAWLREDT
jgi:hypothetical protein